jgi:hypothetical protein
VTGGRPTAPPDRFVTGDVVSPIVPWAPSLPAALDQTPYLAYLAREARGEPTDRARLDQLFPRRAT